MFANKVLMSIVARSGNSFKNLIKTFPQQKSSTELKDKTLKNSETKTMSSTFKIAQCVH